MDFTPFIWKDDTLNYSPLHLSFLLKEFVPTENAYGYVMI